MNFQLAKLKAATNEDSNNESKIIEAIDTVKTIKAPLYRPPKLKCCNFSGTDQDELSFKDFLVQFKNSITLGQELPGAAKLGHLRGYLSGYAFSLIKHLTLTNENYKAAKEILKKV